MDTLIKLVGGVVVLMLMVALFAFFSGTILWFVWSWSIPHAFPRLVNEEWLAPNLSWWQSVSLSWVAGILVKGSSSSSSSKK